MQHIIRVTVLQKAQHFRASLIGRKVYKIIDTEEDRKALYCSGKKDDPGSGKHD